MERDEHYLTSNGLVTLKTELKELTGNRRPEIAELIRKASEVGGVVDNGEYDEAKRLQAQIEGRILVVENLLRNAVLIDETKKPTKIVEIGSTVTVNMSGGNKLQYRIVGSVEVDPKCGKISNESPIGKALLGRYLGDEVEARTPVGVVKLKICQIG